MGKMRTLLKIATTVGPAVYSVVRRYGPEIRQIMNENPELFDTMKGRVTALASAGASQRGITKLKLRLGVLREQTTYLYGTANNAAVAEQATAWRREIDLLDNSLPLVASMKGKNRRSKLREIENRIDDLAAKILAMTWQDDIEDAEVIDEG